MIPQPYVESQKSEVLYSSVVSWHSLGLLYSSKKYKIQKIHCNFTVDISALESVPALESNWSGRREEVFYLPFCSWRWVDLAPNPELSDSRTALPSDLLKVIQGNCHSIHQKPTCAVGKRVWKERRRKTHLTCYIFCKVQNISCSQKLGISFILQ